MTLIGSPGHVTVDAQKRTNSAAENPYSSRGCDANVPLSGRRHETYETRDGIKDGEILKWSEECFVGME
jgi:hypothetical protein